MFFNIFLQHKMSTLTTGIWDEDNDDDDDDDEQNDKFDDELNDKFDDEEDDFGFGYFFVISELQVTRKAKLVHQRLNWLAHVKKLEHENIFCTHILHVFSSLHSTCRHVVSVHCL